MSKKPLIVALDIDHTAAALALAEKLPPELCRVKVGKELFTREGHVVIDALHKMGHEIFLDLKFHDIPNTVAGAVRAAADLGIWLVNVHASGGQVMMEAAADALAHYRQPPLLIAVTVLTSMDAAQLESVGILQPVAAQVARLTALAAQSGMNGVVCSAQEAGTIKKQYGKNFLTVTPGIRPTWAAQDDQIRTMTPKAALMAGSDYLVIGRPITRAPDPLEALTKIIASF